MNVAGGWKQRCGAAPADGTQRAVANHPPLVVPVARRRSARGSESGDIDVQVLPITFDYRKYLWYSLNMLAITESELVANIATILESEREQARAFAEAARSMAPQPLKARYDGLFSLSFSSRLPFAEKSARGCHLRRGFRNGSREAFCKHVHRSTLRAFDDVRVKRERDVWVDVDQDARRRRNVYASRDEVGRGCMTRLREGWSSRPSPYWRDERGRWLPPWASDAPQVHP